MKLGTIHILPSDISSKIVVKNDYLKINIYDLMVVMTICTKDVHLNEAAELFVH